MVGWGFLQVNVGIGGVGGLGQTQLFRLGSSRAITLSCISLYSGLDGWVREWIVGGKGVWGVHSRVMGVEEKVRVGDG